MATTFVPSPTAFDGRISIRLTPHPPSRRSLIRSPTHRGRDFQPAKTTRPGKRFGAFFMPAIYGGLLGGAFVRAGSLWPVLETSCSPPPYPISSGSGGGSFSQHKEPRHDQHPHLPLAACQSLRRHPHRPQEPFGPGRGLRGLAEDHGQALAGAPPGRDRQESARRLGGPSRLGTRGVSGPDGGAVISAFRNSAICSSGGKGPSKLAPVSPSKQICPPMPESSPTTSFVVVNLFACWQNALRTSQSLSLSCRDITTVTWLVGISTSLGAQTKILEPILEPIWPYNGTEARRFLAIP